LAHQRDNQAMELTLTRPDDWHVHLRDEAALRAVVPYTAKQFRRALIMPNLRPPITTTQQAKSYRARIMAALPTDTDFEPWMTLYLTDNTAPDEIDRAVASGIVIGVKLYPAGATTNSDHGVTDLALCMATLERMQALGLPLLVHGEVTDKSVDVFDREAVFLDQIMIPLRRQLPELKVVFEHITTREAAQYVRDADGKIGATITPQHLLYSRNAIFSGGLRPNLYCLPVLKREIHREALVEAATSGNPRFFLGTDTAPHAMQFKEHAAVCAAGCFTGLHAMELYASAFEAAGALDRLEAFASFHGADFYGVPRNIGKVSLRRESWTIPESVPFLDSPLMPMAAGESLQWRFVG
jgi:dihydroorotase